MTCFVFLRYVYLHRMMAIFALPFFFFIWIKKHIEEGNCLIGYEEEEESGGICGCGFYFVKSLKAHI